VSDERETLTYELFGTASRELAHQVVDGGYEPDLILSIARGGLFLAGALGYALDVKNLFTMNVEFYTGVGTTLDAPVMLPPLLDTADLVDMAVLVVDDVADTGKTLELVTDFCRGHVAEARSAVLYEKPTTVVEADYVWRRTDRWIDFPWSS
jgi:hypoxanthine phosphoribosyltransferase